MGILDDAIREHLDLKRRHGADETELQHLEDEAFGPPARPGEPDFPERADEQAVAAEGQAVEQELASLDADQTAPEDAPRAAEPEPLPEPPAPADFDDEFEADEEEGSFSTEEREAIASQPTQLFEPATSDAEIDFGDLDLDLDEELAEVEGELDAAAEPAAPDEPAAPVEAGTPLPEPEMEPDDADAEEPSVEDALDLGEEIEETPAPGLVDDLKVSSEEGEEGSDAENEDVLEETPEFLRDHPDDDELWFEQGEPKDFDF